MKTVRRNFYTRQLNGALRVPRVGATAGAPPYESAAATELFRVAQHCRITVAYNRIAQPSRITLAYDIDVYKTYIEYKYEL